MKRFVDIRLAKVGGRFAWYDTVTDTFESHSGEMTWDCWQDFERDRSYQGDQPDRYRGLMPDWAMKPPIGDEEPLAMIEMLVELTEAIRQEILELMQETPGPAQRIAEAFRDGRFELIQTLKELSESRPSTPAAIVHDQEDADILAVTAKATANCEVNIHVGPYTGDEAIGTISPAKGQIIILCGDSYAESSTGVCR